MDSTSQVVNFLVHDKGVEPNPGPLDSLDSWDYLECTEVDLLKDCMEEELI